MQGPSRQLLSIYAPVRSRTGTGTWLAAVAGAVRLPNVLTAGALLLAYVGLEWVSFIHEYKGVPVTPWNPGLGVAFALLVLKGAALRARVVRRRGDRRNLRAAHGSGMASHRRHGGHRLGELCDGGSRRAAISAPRYRAEPCPRRAAPAGCGRCRGRRFRSAAEHAAAHRRRADDRRSAQSLHPAPRRRRHRHRRGDAAPVAPVAALAGSDAEVPGFACARGDAASGRRSGSSCGWSWAASAPATTSCSRCCFCRSWRLRCATASTARARRWPQRSSGLVAVLHQYGYDAERVHRVPARHAGPHHVRPAGRRGGQRAPACRSRRAARPRRGSRTCRRRRGGPRA